MDFTNFFTTQNIIQLFFKLFSIVFSVMYLLYAVIIERQTTIMNKTLQSKEAGLIFVVSTLQIVAGVLLVLLSLVI